MDEEFWSAMVDRQRRAILDVLRGRPRAVGELVDALGMRQPAVSKHLRVLRDAGLVTVQIEAQRRIYALDLDRIKGLDGWLEPYRTLWNARLDALGDHLENDEDKEK